MADELQDDEERKFNAFRYARLSGRPEDYRSPGERDSDRILYSSAFRRLGGVTQVVAVHEVQLFHNRLTHSLKVAQIGKRTAKYLRTNTTPALLRKVGSSRNPVKPGPRTDCRDHGSCQGAGESAGGCPEQTSRTRAT